MHPASFPHALPSPRRDSMKSCISRGDRALRVADLFAPIDDAIPRLLSQPRARTGRHGTERGPARKKPTGNELFERTAAIWISIRLS